jgi:hypothetical protein
MIKCFVVNTLIYLENHHSVNSYTAFMPRLAKFAVFSQKHIAFAGKERFNDGNFIHLE